MADGVQERAVKQIAAEQPVTNPNGTSDQERGRLRPAADHQDAADRDDRKQVDECVEADHQAEPERQTRCGGQQGRRREIEPSPAGSDPVIRHGRVGQQAQAAEQQDLHCRLAQRGPADVLLRKAEAQRERGGRCPLRPDEPGREAGEAQRCQAAEDRADGGGASEPVHPEPARQQHRQPRLNGGIERGPASQEAGAGETQPGVRAPERCQSRRNRQRAMLSNPVARLQVSTRITEHDQRGRTFRQLPPGQPGNDSDRRQQAEPGRPAWLSRPVAGQQPGPAGRDDSQPVGNDGSGYRHRDQQHRNRHERPGEQ